MVAYQFAVIATTLGVGGCLFRVVLAGIRTRRTGRAAGLALRHRRLAQELGWSSLVLVLLIEVGVRLTGGSERDGIFWLHLGFAACYSASLVTLLFFYNGYRGAYHALLGYVCAGSYFGLAILGIKMALERF
jgi:hypothetical protein